jgi:signal transduction histidine kinase
MNFLKPVFSAADYLPHSFCYLSQPALIRLHLLTDLAIGISYVAIALTLAYLVYRMRRDIPFHWMVLAFGLFIIACGFTHFMEVLTLWIPLYWLAGGVKLVTALASVVTAVFLPPLVPKTRVLIHAAQTAEQYQLELEKSHAELESVYARLKGLDELKSQLFANVSHELRTPLALILGPAEKMLARPDLPAEQRLDVEVMQRNARTLLKHVNDLLDLAKLESGKIEMTYVDSDLAKMFRTTSAHFDGIAYDRKIDFVVEAPPTLLVRIDPEKMARVLLNLLSNAFTFTPATGKIRFVLEAADDRVLVTIRDSGPGVPREMREAIFERFCQVESAENRRFGGAGLGLAIVKEFVELHGGAIAVGDAPEGGAMFVVTLPRLAASSRFAQRDDGIKSNIEEVAAVSGAFRLNSEKPPATKAEPGVSRQDVRPVVLIVEDNPEMNAFLSDTLARDYAMLSG